MSSLFDSQCDRWISRDSQFCLDLKPSRRQMWHCVLIWAGCKPLDLVLRCSRMMVTLSPSLSLFLFLYVSGEYDWNSHVEKLRASGVSVHKCGTLYLRGKASLWLQLPLGLDSFAQCALPERGLSWQQIAHKTKSAEPKQCQKTRSMKFLASLASLVRRGLGLLCLQTCAVPDKRK